MSETLHTTPRKLLFCDESEFEIHKGLPVSMKWGCVPTLAHESDISGLDNYVTTKGARGGEAPKRPRTTAGPNK